MKKYNGDLTIENDTVIDFTEISGVLYVCESAKLEAPVLQSVGNYISVRESAKLEAPVLQSVGGGIYVYESAKLEVPALQSVGGGIYVYESAKLEAPNLKKEKLSQQEIYKLKTGPKKLNQQHFEKMGYLFADGILQTITSKKLLSNLTIYKTKKIAKDETSFVVYDGEYYSHGETLKQAKNDLMFKRTSQDTTKFKSWSLSDKKTIEELVEAYRSITGACSLGVKDFCASRKLKDSYTIKEAIEITKNSYENKKFADFFRKGLK